MRRYIENLSDLRHPRACVLAREHLSDMKISDIGALAKQATSDKGEDPLRSYFRFIARAIVHYELTLNFQVWFLTSSEHFPKYDGPINQWKWIPFERGIPPKTEKLRAEEYEEKAKRMHISYARSTNA